MKTALLLAIVSFLPVCAPHQQAEQHHSSYAGQQPRNIKALSDNEIAAYRDGHGMGLAKAAELNHYPGPKHVIELAAALELSASQRAAVQQAYDRMHARAVLLGETIIAKEKSLDSLFASQALEAAALSDKIAEIALLQGGLRTAHLLAHLEMKKILTAEQVAKYDELRGYHMTAPKQHSASHSDHQ